MVDRVENKRTRGKIYVCVCVCVCVRALAHEESASIRQKRIFCPKLIKASDN